MGAWAEDTFGNDTACDWVSEFMDNPNIAFINKTIDEVLSEDDYLDSDVACECLAACEAIARLQGNWGIRNAYSEDLDKWIESYSPKISGELVEKAKLAIQRILSDDSELAELWDEGGRNDDWHDSVDDLLKRLKS